MSAVPLPLTRILLVLGLNIKANVSFSLFMIMPSVVLFWSTHPHPLNLALAGIRLCLGRLELLRPAGAASRRRLRQLGVNRAAADGRGQHSGQGKQRF